MKLGFLTFVSRRRGDGSAMTLFWLFFGIGVVGVAVLVSAFVVPRDRLQKYLPTEASERGLYLHIRGERELLRFFPDAEEKDLNEAALWFIPENGTARVLFRYADGTITDGTKNIPPVSGDTPLALWPIQGWIRTPAISTEIQGRVDAEAQIRAILSERGASVLVSPLLSFSACTSPFPDSLVADHPFVAQASRLPSNYAAPLLFADIMAYAAKFSAYENPYTTEAYAKVNELFAQPLLLEVDDKGVPLLVLREAKVSDAKDSLLTFIRAVIPVVAAKRLPDGTTVQEFTLSPESFAWSAPDADGVVSLVSSENRVTLYLATVKESVVLSPSRVALLDFLHDPQSTAVLEKRFRNQISFSPSHGDKSAEALFSFLGISTVYAHDIVDNFAILCAKK